ncbi:DNA mismatch repair protein MutL [Dysgonomonas sp. PH5-45]|uniref:DNA mismatch repair endonuclease MutL n=1 Tax=unclassified Dysgonomonas TaxID=2630389 RepID=UPI002473BB9C|nr:MULTISPECIES: DNA mismatch repair endonuclease MutL [unclassified Dysgonomonas]MDH6355334.1 DNA mismatch repair protein MutL [Dysgonomonas sp. PH5-45]MDH6388232.1 DNA mismatch repair protein MutL [Dysgonomonas sp. PH5-37]
MSDIIHLLPDSIANQIAAGEVVQRPASVVKELVENSIDAGATSIQILIKNAGRTSIQVIDNGKGMSGTDARMAFERHATSKISRAEDLFALHTMGFRGEALASIAAVAHVEVRTRRGEDEIGTCISVVGSKVESQETIACSSGTVFSVKNLFFNVPARRKFLKSNETEKRHILTELERIALVNPEIEFLFVDNDIEAFRYPASNLKQRIINVIGKGQNQHLIPIEIETSLVKIYGFVGKPESARKSKALQYFFVNGRYMRHPYFGKAVTTAFEHLISVGENPNYFIYLEVDPQTIDVNIHPTKTEIKFENEQPIWQILQATIKEALGKSNEVPSIDFNTSDAIDIPVHDPSRYAPPPRVNVDRSYNPFKPSAAGQASYRRPDLDWNTFYRGLEKNEEANASDETFPSDNIFQKQNTADNVQQEGQAIHYQYKNRYILTSIKSGLMLIDQHRAHVRILFELFLMNIRQNRGVSQRVLFPEIVEFSPSESAMIPYLMDDFEAVGFDLSNMGNNAYAINGIPSEFKSVNATDLLHRMITSSIETGSDAKDEIQESLALSMAYAAAIPYGQRLAQEEMSDIVDRLFASAIYKHTPDGKTIITTLADDYIDKLFR